MYINGKTAKTTKCIPSMTKTMTSVASCHLLDGGSQTPSPIRLGEASEASEIEFEVIEEFGETMVLVFVVRVCRKCYNLTL